MAEITRRRLLVSGGLGVGLLVAWGIWPRTYRPNLAGAPDERVLNAFVKIARDGRVTVAVPQCEHGQGVYTTLAQIVADELGADWRTVGVEAAPVSPLYANPLAAGMLFGDGFSVVPERVRDELWTRDALMLTAGSTSVRRFEAPLREAGAAARVLLCQAAAKRWDVDWRDCTTADGFVVQGKQRLRFGELAEGAAGGALPDELPLRIGDDGRLTGTTLPRLDVPAKVDGSANFVADIRLPDMVFASIRQAPHPAARLRSANLAAAERVPGLVQVVRHDHWIAAVANSWWAANRALTALAPRFEGPAALPNDATITAALDAALKADGRLVAAVGDIDGAMAGGRLVEADYAVLPGLHAAVEPPAATAQWQNDRLELWAATQAPSLARAAAADAIGVAADQVVIHPMLVGGSFGAALEVEVVRQVAILAKELRRPVQLCWSRGEALLHDRVRSPARARMSARLAVNGAILGWRARIAAARTGRELSARLLPDDPLRRMAAVLPAGADTYAMRGATPPYRLPALAIDHHPLAIELSTGHLRGGADGYNAFFTESFLDEVARAAGSEPMSYRIGMLGGDVRLARCLTTVAALGGWSGGVPGSGQGIACHRMAGSAIAVLAEAGVDAGGRPRVDRLVAAVDVGRTINPDVVRQQIEGGLLFGVAMARGSAAHFADGLASLRRYGELNLPRLADVPEVTIELIPSTEDPGGVGDLGVPAVAPAIANALFAAGGTRWRNLPFRSA